MSATQSPANDRTPRGKAWFLVLLLYLATLSVDAGRKMIGLPGSTLGIVYLLAGVIYLFFLRGIKSRLRAAPAALPIWLVLLSIWCVIEAIVPRVPISMAMLGWSSYVFFVPLLYIGAELMSDDRRAALTLRIVAIAGAAVGLGAIVSALEGQSAPALLQPMVPSAGIHSFDTGNIYLAPSIFATAEEAAEALLIALFAWIALAHLPLRRLGRTSSAAVGVLVAAGLIATERRADIVVAVAGVVALQLLRRVKPTGVKTTDMAGRRLPGPARQPAPGWGPPSSSPRSERSPWSASWAPASSCPSSPQRQMARTRSPSCSRQPIPVPWPVRAPGHRHRAAAWWGQRPSPALTAIGHTSAMTLPADLSSPPRAASPRPGWNSASQESYYMVKYSFLCSRRPSALCAEWTAQAAR